MIKRSVRYIRTLINSLHVGSSLETDLVAPKKEILSNSTSHIDNEPVTSRSVVTHTFW